MTTPNTANTATVPRCLRLMPRAFYCGISRPEPHPDAAQRLRALRELYDQGMLMESEYQAKRAEIIAGL